MTRSLRRLAPHTTRQGTSPTLIDRYVGSEGVATLAWYPPGLSGPLGIALIDTTHATEITVSIDEVGWWHPLWIRDEAAATVQPLPAAPVPIAPGDAMTLASGTRCTVNGGQLGMLVTAPGQSGVTSAPSHGIETFHGHQRRTTLPAPPGLAISRWKLTGSIRLDRHHRGPAVVIALAGKPVLATPREALPVPRGAAVLADLSEVVTVHPGALAYLLVVESSRSSVAPCSTGVHPR